MPVRADVLARGISYLITLREGPYRRVREDNAGIIRDAAVAWRNGRIVWVGREIDSHEVKARETLDFGGRVVTPGFVDSHTHLVFAGERQRELWMKLEGKSYLEILESGGGIYYTVRKTREASVESLADRAARTLYTMKRYGASLVEAKTGYGLLPEYEKKMLLAARMAEKKVRGVSLVHTVLAHVVPEEYEGRREEYVDLFVREIIPMARDMGAEFVDVFCDKGAFSVEETRRIVGAGIRAGLKPRLHSDELANIGCHRLALEYEIYSLDHLEHLPPGQVSALAKTRTVLTLLPTSMLSVFSDRRPPVEEMRRRGALIGIASDYNPNNMTPSMKHVLELAIYLYRLTPLEALAAATVNAAYSLDRPDYGRIARGSVARLVVWDFEDYRKIGYEWGYDNLHAVI